MTMQAENPFYQEFTAHHGAVPFSAINNSYWEAAIDSGIAKAKSEIDAIVKQRSMPDFDNTIAAMAYGGQDLNRVLNVFFPLLSANADDEMMDISARVTPKLSDFSTGITLNEALWERVKYVYEHRDKYDLDDEDKMLLQNTYDSFAHNGANLQGEDRETYRRLSSELSSLTTDFGQNVLKENRTYEVYLTADDLAGLPQSVIDAAAQSAADKGRAGEYRFTLDQPVYIAFMKYSQRADLRQKMYMLYNGRNTKGEYSNVELMAKIADLRRQIANLLGYKTYTEYALQHTMAKTPEGVYDLLGRLRTAYAPALKAEMAELTAFASQYEGHEVTINPWDYSYYSNKLKAAKYSFDEEALRPYFPLDKVIDGVFGLATRLYGLQFTPNDSVDVYHPDVKAYDVTDEAGNYVGLLYTDFFPRATKRPGAWMTNFSEQSITPDGVNHRPVVTIVMNFNKPTAETPALLTPYEVETFLHEFGHSLHGLLADTKYPTLSGTSVYRDFVELPSQFNENYLTEKEFLDTFARDYRTGEAIPQELIDRLVASTRYGAAYACMRQLTFGYLDMAWHSTTEYVTDPVEFEKNAIEQVAVFPYVDGTMISPCFSHIFSGGYASGYYSYKWAEVLDADAFSLFKQRGIFDRATAHSFRDNILRKGGTVSPDELYRRFRGQDPTIDALLERDGITVGHNSTVAQPQKD